MKAISPKRTSAVERFDKIKAASNVEDCWIWDGGRALHSGGVYGMAYFQKLRIPAHRAAYLYWVGEIPPKLVVDHLCRNTECINPDHLEAVTQGESIRRGLLGRLKANVCRKGHEYTPDNIIVNKSSGKRQCRTCRNQSRRLWQLEGKS